MCTMNCQPIGWQPLPYVIPPAMHILTRSLHRTGRRFPEHPLTAGISSCVLLSFFLVKIAETCCSRAVYKTKNM
jgi:hypothetical protein